jgi:O-antigen/teichoic acid export membrane protein
MTTGSTWLRSGIQVAGALLTALLLFVLVPHWGGMGAALVTSVTYTVLAAASLMVYLPSTRLTLSDYLIPTATDLRDLRSMFGRVLQRLKQVVP